MTRIKYVREPVSNYLISQWFHVSPNLLVIANIIPYPDNKYQVLIQDNNKYSVFVTGPITLRAAKSQVRKKLIELGLKLDDEIRRNSDTSKG